MEIDGTVNDKGSNQESYLNSLVEGRQCLERYFQKLTSAHEFIKNVKAKMEITENERDLLLEKIDELQEFEENLGTFKKQVSYFKKTYFKSDECKKPFNTEKELKELVKSGEVTDVNLEEMDYLDSMMMVLGRKIQINAELDIIARQGLELNKKAPVLDFSSVYA